MISFRQIFLIGLLSATAALAELPAIRLNHIFPAGGQTGTTFEVTIEGADLDQTGGLLFSHPGITASGSNKFSVAILSNVPPAVYDVRIHGRFGISNPRAFEVGLLNEVTEGSTSNNPTGAMTIVEGTVVNGKTAANAIDYFQVTGQKDKPLQFHCQASAIDSKLEPVLILSIQDGQEVARSRRGGLLEYTPSAEQPLILGVHDLLFRGGSDFYYRLSVTSGSSIEPLIRQIALLPEIGETNQIKESGTNNSVATAHSFVPPAEISGVWEKAGQGDYFTFEAKKGDTYWIDVASHRLGFPTDPLLVVKLLVQKENRDILELNDEGNIGGIEFNTAHRDPSGKFEAKENGTYILYLRNLFTANTKTPLAYKFTVRKPNPGFDLAAFPNVPLPKKDAKDIPLSTTVLRKGETAAIKLIAFRRDGFNGPIDIAVDHLPGTLSAPNARIDAGKSSALLFLHAGSGATSEVTSIAIKGTALIADSNVVKMAKPATIVRTVPDKDLEAISSRYSQNYTIAIINDPFPLRINPPATNHFEAKAGSEIKIPFNVIKECELKTPLKLKAVGNLAADQVKEFDLDPKATNLVVTLNTAKPKMEPGTYTFSLQGLAEIKPLKDSPIKNLKETTVTVYSSPVTIKVTPEPVQSASK